MEQGSRTYGTEKTGAAAGGAAGGGEAAQCVRPRIGALARMLEE